jgi:hypothetical protein
MYDCLQNLSVCYYLNNDFKNELKFANRAFEMTQRLCSNEDSMECVVGMKRVAAAYQRNKDPQSALKFSNKAENMQKRLTRTQI